MASAEDVPSARFAGVRNKNELSIASEGGGPRASWDESLKSLVPSASEPFHANGIPMGRVSELITL